MEFFRWQCVAWCIEISSFSWFNGSITRSSTKENNKSLFFLCVVFNSYCFPQRDVCLKIKKWLGTWVIDAALWRIWKSIKSCRKRTRWWWWARCPVRKSRGCVCATLSSNRCRAFHRFPRLSKAKLNWMRYAVFVSLPRCVLIFILFFVFCFVFFDQMAGKTAVFPRPHQISEEDAWSGHIFHNK